MISFSRLRKLSGPVRLVPILQIAVFFLLWGMEKNTLGSPYLLPTPQDYDRFDVYFLAMDVGTSIDQQWGHTALRLVDHQADTDMVAAWGYFDFSAPNFGWNFFRGILIYQFGFQTFNATIKTYMYEKRTVWQDKINLTRVQKERLVRKLQWNALPENRPYPYYYFFDNCATRPRDYLDQALGGAFKQRFGEVKTGLTYRDMLGKHMATTPFFRASLDILMNSRMDREMTTWAEMFLPLSLRRYLQEMPAIDDDGQPRLGETLLSEPKVLLEYPNPVPSPVNGYAYFSLPLALFLAWGASLYVKRKTVAGASDVPRRGSWEHKSLGIAALLFGVLGGLYGGIMFIAWGISEHLDLHHNANLWLFWPADFIWLAVGFVWLRSGRSIPSESLIGKMASVLAVGHIFAGVAQVMLRALGVIEQNVFEPELFCLPLILLLSVLTLTSGVRKTET